MTRARKPGWLGRAVAAIGRNTGWTFLAIGAVGTPALMLGIHCHERHAFETNAGELRRADLQELEDGHPVVVASVTVRHTTGGRATGGTSTEGRIDVLDAIDGHRRATAAVTTSTECSSAGPGLLWCDTNYGLNTDLEVRALATLDVKVSNAALVAAAPRLAVHGAAHLDAVTHEAWIPTSDGRFWHVDPATLKSGVADQLPVHEEGARKLDPTASINLPAATLSFQGDVLQLDDHQHPPHALGAAGLDHPRFVVADRTALTSEGGAVVFVAHDAGTAPRQLAITAQGLDGRERWTTLLERGEIKAAWILGDRLVLAIGTLRSAIVALDLASGAVAWRTPA